VKLPRFNPDALNVDLRESETREPVPAATPRTPTTAITPYITIGFQPSFGAVRAGGTIELLVEVQPAPADGAVVAISAPWRSKPVADITLQPGTTSGQTTLVVPPNTAPGDHAIEARTEVSVQTQTLRVFAADAPRLVSFTITPEALLGVVGGPIRVDVGLDRPAPEGGALVAISPTQLQKITVPAGSTSAFANWEVPPTSWSGTRTVRALLRSG
jgi:hypothetical protein